MIALTIFINISALWWIICEILIESLLKVKFCATQNYTRHSACLQSNEARPKWPMSVEGEGVFLETGAGLSWNIGG